MKKLLICLMILAAREFFPTPSFGITAEALKAIMERNEKITIIDVRNNSEFSRAHIQDSINIPANSCSTRRLPPIGQAIVYGDDISIALTIEALGCFNSKSGIRAELLEGGIGRWDALNYPMIKGNGFIKDENIYISYQQLVDVVKNIKELHIVDLRRTANPERANQNAITSSQGLVDLSAQFPGIRVKTLPSENGVTEESARGLFVSNLKGDDSGHADLYVLIDSLNGVAEDMAKRFKESGIKRFVILAGGEEMLVRKGKSEIKTR